MGHKHFVVCDGCDAEELIVRPEDEKPPSFKSVTLSLNGGSDKSYDLCPECERQLLSLIDPQKWTRHPIVLER
jgi:hypothetical protein